MTKLRNLTSAEIATVESLGTTAEDWSRIRVSEDFNPRQLLHSRLTGRVELASGARIIDSHVGNYRIGERSIVRQVTSLECRRESTFGNGTPVATMNECAGRTVLICDALTAQAAYAMAVYRHRPAFQEAMRRMVRDRAELRRATMGSVGRDCRIAGARFIREMRIGDRVTIDGASLLEEGTLCDGAQAGIDVKASHFIAAEDSRLDRGALIERCFVGESCILSNGFTAADSLFFANSHCENGEAVSIFAGPYTVSHHKSSLLIAGMFSFFNAGSGSNQSNHLFKSGAVHQSVHLRGCKFASSAYIMSPALEGAFTMILGHHSFHHDTSDFPYSYLIEKDGRSVLMPGANLTSYGAVRDIEKWPARDKRSVGRDLINFEEYNPYVCGGFVRAVNTLHALAEADPDAATYNHKKVIIKSTMLRRGITLYNKAIVASLGAMLAKGVSCPDADGRGRWIDAAGQYVTKRAMEELLDDVERGSVADFAAFDARLRAFAARYDDYAHSYAEELLAGVLGHRPDAQEVADAVASGRNAHGAMRRATDADRDRDCSIEMAVSYGLDADPDDPGQVREDYHAVRGLE
ncbi:DUF4954 family protein [uncultured Alistipes sp.]|uniref:DUF4954 family protein n=3 Tax=uncultured Alistipes sp. TaxID=538949 RepID=UPI00260CA1CE|nr:DUF4954 family protein [uncultured Alistipes sp.]